MIQVMKVVILNFIPFPKAHTPHLVIPRIHLILRISPFLEIRVWHDEPGRSDSLSAYCPNLEKARTRKRLAREKGSHEKKARTRKGSHEMICHVILPPRAAAHRIS
jgi:hypothetical protein